MGHSYYVKPFSNANREAFQAIGNAVASRAEHDIAEVAEQSSASAEQVSASTQQTSASTQQIAASAQELAATAERLDNVVGRFKLAV